MWIEQWDVLRNVTKPVFWREIKCIKELPWSLRISEGEAFLINPVSTYMNNNQTKWLFLYLLWTVWPSYMTEMVFKARRSVERQTWGMTQPERRDFHNMLKELYQCVQHACAHTVLCCILSMMLIYCFTDICSILSCDKKIVSQLLTNHALCYLFYVRVLCWCCT